MIIDKLEKAKYYVRENKVLKAINLLKKVLAENNDEFHRDAFFELAKIYYLNKDYNLANKNIYRAFQFNKEDKDTIFLWAKILKETNKLWAVKLFLKLRKMVSLNEKNKIDREILSIFLSKKNYVSAIRYIEKYCVFNERKNKIYRYLLQKITRLNNTNNFNEARVLSYNALKKLKISDQKIKNAIMNEFEIASDIVQLRSFPRCLTISLTEKCNLKCKMCPQSKNKNRQELTRDQLRNVIKIFPILEKVLWVGGEVFLYRDFENLLDIAHECGIKQNITSNGLLITENYARKIVDYNIELNLSIDSVNKDVYEFIREGASFDILLKNIKRIKYYREQKKTNSRLMLNAVLSKWNFEIENNFFDILRFAKENSFDGVNIYIDAFEEDNFIRNKLITSFNDQSNELFKLSKKLRLKLNNFVYSDYRHIEDVIFRKKCKRDFNDLDSRGFKVYNDIVIEDYNYNEINCFLKKPSQQKRCLLPWKKLYVSYSGNVLNECHCPVLAKLKNKIDYNFRNIRNGYNDIIGIWNGEKLIKMRQKVIKNNLRCIKNCYLDTKYKKPISFR